MTRSSAKPSTLASEPSAHEVDLDLAHALLVRDGSRLGLIVTTPDAGDRPATQPALQSIAVLRELLAHIEREYADGEHLTPLGNALATAILELLWRRTR